MSSKSDVLNRVNSLDVDQLYNITTEYRNCELYKITIEKENKK